MELTKQVVSLELAKKLKELGVKQDYQPYDAYWVKLSSGEWRLMFLETQEDPPTQTPFEHCRAYTVAELGEMLPLNYEEFRTGKNYKGKWFVLNSEIDFEADTEADARAKMLVYLLENNLITL